MAATDSEILRALAVCLVNADMKKARLDECVTLHRLRHSVDIKPPLDTEANGHGSTMTSAPQKATAVWDESIQWSSNLTHHSLKVC
jgi:hypothetical protein